MAATVHRLQATAAGTVGVAAEEFRTRSAHQTPAAPTASPS
jgi:hypothetical protein